MVKRLAVIPARGGSKRIPNKNIRNFFGKPMIAYILEAARASELFDVIHVSTESANILQTVEGLGFRVEFMRPAELADDHTPIMPVLKYVTDTYASLGQEFDQVWSLMACAPLVGPEKLQRAAELFDQSGGADPILAVAEYPVPIEWAFSRSQDGRLKPVQPGMFSVRSQDLEKRYFDAGVFAAFPAAKVRTSDGAGSEFDFIGYVIPKGSAIDIDDEADWILAESIYRNLKGVWR